MAQFQVCEVFRLPTRGQCVIAGKVTDGTIRSGMKARALLDGALLWSIQMAAVEFIGRIAKQESLLGLVCVEKIPEDAELCEGLCGIGTEN
jgi:hypothetical protein